MLKKTIFITQKSSLKVKNRQLLIQSETREGSIPIEDIGFVVVENQESFLSLPALNLLIENNAAVLVCGNNHLPNGMFLNLNSHHIQQEIFKNQIQASQPLKKQLWQQTVVEKIKNQGLLLEKISGSKNHFPFLAEKVLSGDSSNMEGVAAQAYWKAYFEKDITRTRFGEFPNNYLNYGYAILRAAVARALSGSGLLCTLGIHHRNKYNAFALADDIMEPFRPIVDEKVYALMQENCSEALTTQSKAALLEILTRTVYFKDEKSPLMVGLSKTTASLQQCFLGDRKRIKYPKLWN
ncbi:MAG: type II CRISPR-associated endonuclease Cas1 [Flavobacteriaceae bacterium]|nr:type II CRISPR-associated endonuclease Cas1 [Flavobacteriaceae bacterium]